MVRLKDSKVISDITAGKFQFHYGTIKRINKINKIPLSFNFNSTMVRLKVANS